MWCLKTPPIVVNLDLVKIKVEVETKEIVLLQICFIKSFRFILHNTPLYEKSY